MDDFIEGLVILNKYYCKPVFFNGIVCLFINRDEMESTDVTRMSDLGFDFDEDNDCFTFSDEDDDEYGNELWDHLDYN